MSPSAPRNFLGSSDGKKGLLTGVKPPAGSQWKLYNSAELWKTPIFVPKFIGEHELGWVILNTRNEPKIMFSLYQKNRDGFVAVDNKTIPARPTFTILDDMHRRHRVGGAMPAAEDYPEMFKRLGLAAPSYDDYHAAMKERHECLYGELCAWLRPGENTDKLAAMVYMAVSADMKKWLAAAPAPARSPDPGQPGN